MRHVSKIHRIDTRRSFESGECEICVLHVLVFLVPSQDADQFEGSVSQRSDLVVVQLAGVHVMSVVAVLNRQSDYGFCPVLVEDWMEDRLRPTDMLGLYVELQQQENPIIGFEKFNAASRMKEHDLFIKDLLINSFNSFRILMNTVSENCCCFQELSSSLSITLNLFLSIFWYSS